MPELPEVEVVTQGLSPLIMGKTFVHLTTSGQALRLPIPTAQLHEHILQHKVVKVYRRAKYVVIGMDNGALLIFHLGMTGRIALFHKKEESKRHDHVRIRFDNKQELRLNDTRRFGSVQVYSSEELKHHPPFLNLGPEPFDRKYNSEYLIKMAGNRKQPVKNFIMDNRIVVGIGNIYASETLYAAKISPQTPIGTIKLDKWEKIVRESRKVLKKAIKCGGTTIADFVNTKGEAGYFQVELNVYGRENQSCPQCKTPIERMVMAGRATFFCPACQK